MIRTHLGRARAAIALASAASAGAFPSDGSGGTPLVCIAECGRCPS
ncbi:MAG: hypothetical protein K8E66_14115 [Phycisphaerales bacterium]|nr:hypothetical protein [Phycisphaerales bacterium]